MAAAQAVGKLGIAEAAPVILAKLERARKMPPIQIDEQRSQFNAIFDFVALDRLTPRFWLSRLPQNANWAPKVQM